jgi:protein-tyrosine phosphatase
LEIGKIFNNLYVGSGIEKADDITALQALGINAVLSLQTEHDIELEGFDIQTLTDLYSLSGIRFVRTPIRDYDVADMTENLAHSVENLRALIDDGRTVYVHCTMGWNRSPTVIIAYLHWHRRMRLERATQYVLERKECDPALDVIRRVTKAQKRISAKVIPLRENR